MEDNPRILSVHRSDDGPAFQTGGGLCRERLHAALRSGDLKVDDCQLQWSRGVRTRLARLRAEISCGWPFYAEQVHDCRQLTAALAAMDFDCVLVEELETASAVLPAVTAWQRRSRARWILYSHGLFSQDHLYDFPTGSLRNLLKRVRRIPHQGRLLAREQEILGAFDAVWVLNEQELEIARWLGARELRVVSQACLPGDLSRDPVPGRFGFVGTLTHAPNRHGLDSVIEEIGRLGSRAESVELRVVGAAPAEWVQRWRACRNVKVLGQLGDAALAREAASWAAMLHPLYIWAKGRSLKVARALEWGMPLISTPAGVRGYPLENGLDVIVADTPAGFVNAMLGPGSDTELLRRIAENGRRLRTERLSIERVSREIRQALDDLLSRDRAERSGRS